MQVTRPAARFAAAASLLALLAGLVVMPQPAGAADHLDAPGTTSPDGITELDINDVYAFQGRPGTTVLAMTVSPVATADSDFAMGTRTTYSFRVDLDGDAVEDRTYHVRTLFSARDEQFTLVQKATGQAATSLRPRGSVEGFGLTNRTFHIKDRGKVFAGLRSDPFFFDLSGFLGTVEGRGDDMLGQDPTDFFEDLNTLAIVIEVPDSELNDGGPIGVWGTTSRLDGGRWVQVDRMGRPAINTVLNSSGPIVGAPSEAKNLFNDGRPVDDPDDFRSGAISALQAFSSLDVEGAYADDEAGALADVLLPDILTFDKGGTLPPPLNGRGLADDVIDTELRIVTGGDPLDLFPGRDADGAINSDGVGPHDDYLSSFPYLGKPHSS
jgi:hypothetical protein